MKLEQGSIVHWKNKLNQQIIWMVTDQENTGVVIHSDNLLSVGTLTDLTGQQLYPFIGNVNINSQARENKT